MGRLKTGTPPRLDRDSIDFDRARRAAGCSSRKRGDAAAGRRFRSRRRTPLREPDALLAAAHQRSRPRSRSRHIDQSPLFNGQIQGIGPRYCPSLEDKIMRFPDRERHQIYLEPEGLDVDEIYVNGFSMSLPRDVQEELVHALARPRGRGDASARLRGRVRLRPADRAEVDARDARVGGLFFAGQINGTSGYEEAAAQGLVAGINAARRVRRRAAVHARPRRGVHRHPRRRSRHAGLPRAVPDVHVARRASAAASHRQRRPAADAAWPRSRARRRRALGAVRGAAGPLRRGTSQRSIGRWCGPTRAIASRRARCCGSPTSASSAARRQGDVALDSRSIDARRWTSPASRTTIKYAGYLKQEAARAERMRRQERRRIPDGFPFARVPACRAKSCSGSLRCVQRRWPGVANSRRHAGGRRGARRVSSAGSSARRQAVVNSREFQDRLTRRARRPASRFRGARPSGSKPIIGCCRPGTQKINLTGLESRRADAGGPGSAADRALWPPGMSPPAPRA